MLADELNGAEDSTFTPIPAVPTKPVSKSPTLAGTWRMSYLHDPVMLISDSLLIFFELRLDIQINKIRNTYCVLSSHADASGSPASVGDRLSRLESLNQGPRSNSETMKKITGAQERLRQVKEQRQLQQKLGEEIGVS
jgi:hypothetical protein